jgi:hypothetical protein
MLITDGSAVVTVLNNYALWRLVIEPTEAFVFEAWVNTEAEKNALFNELKDFVDEFGESIDWHICTHDEPSPQPCELAETYTGG